MLIIIPKYLLNFLVLFTAFEAFEARIAIVTNVKAIPSAYAPKSKIPLLKLVSASASVKMLPRIGP